MKPVNIILLSVLVILGLAPVSAMGQDGTRISDWSREQFMAAFDEVARNYGAVEYATYTFMVENNRPPENLDELRDSGHLNVVMVNPYTGDDVMSLVEEDYPDGDLIGNVWVSSRDNGHEAHVEVWYLRPDDGGAIYIRSMVKRMYLFESEPEYEYMFGNDLPREEQMVTVYCRQAVDALASFKQRNGRLPDDFTDMYENGDVNVHYINPLTGEPAAASEDISPGDFWYERLEGEEEDGYTLIGWGSEFPVFFGTTDEAVEMAFYLEWPQLLEGDDEDDDDDDDDDCDDEDDDEWEADDKPDDGMPVFCHNQ